MSLKDADFDKDHHVPLSFFNPKGARVVPFAVTSASGTYDALLDVGKDKRITATSH